MPNEIREIVKEYVMDVPDLEHTVKGRITMNPEVDGNLRYMWEISHHYRPSENAAGVYYPSKLHAPTAEEAESHLKGYMSCFTTLDVTPNEDYLFAFHNLRFSKGRCQQMALPFLITSLQPPPQTIMRFADDLLTVY
jgi:hypothetical protein